MRIAPTVLLGALVLASVRIMAQDQSIPAYRVTMARQTSTVRSVQDGSLWTYTVLDNAGSIVTTVRRSVPVDVAAPAPVVLGTGTMVLLHSVDGLAEYYDRRGDLQKRIALLPNAKPEYERIVKAAVHDSLLVLAISEPATSGIRMSVLDAAGSLLSERTITGTSATGVAIAPDSKTIVVGVSEWNAATIVERTTVIEAQRSWSVPVGLQAVRFGPEGHMLIRTNRTVGVVDLVSRTLLWSEGMQDSLLVVDAMLEGGGATILYGRTPVLRSGAWVYSGAVIKTFSDQGTIIAERTIAPHEFIVGRIANSSSGVVMELDGIPQR